MPFLRTEAFDHRLWHALLEAPASLQLLHAQLLFGGSPETETGKASKKPDLALEDLFPST